MPDILRRAAVRRLEAMGEIWYLKYTLKQKMESF